MNLNFTAKTFTTNKIAPVWNHLKGSPTLCCIGVCNDVVLIRVKFVVSRAKPWLHLLYCWNSPLLYIMFGNYCHYLTYFSENVLLVVKLLYGKNILKREEVKLLNRFAFGCVGNRFALNRTNFYWSMQLLEYKMSLKIKIT